MLLQVLYSYEYMLTFSEEIQLIWSWKFSIGTVIFILNCYGTLAYVVTLVMLVFPWSNMTNQLPDCECVSDNFWCNDQCNKHSTSYI
ncbi:hypothetical protein B0H21DRAFT_424071 [Amylocystis lapponica]|nr:hypothetical protein B0H21DRAFT_424071 [Amylocystis lapponica]